MREIELCANADLVHIENKYGQFESIPLPDPMPQMFPSPVTEPLPGEGVKLVSTSGKIAAGGSKGGRVKPIGQDRRAVRVHVTNVHQGLLSS